MSTTKKSNLLPIAIIAGLFFIFGFITWINGALIPYMKTFNQLSEMQSYLVASAFYISFVFASLPASKVINKVGYKNGMSIGLMITAFGALVFIPAAITKTYWIFLSGLFIQGTGITLLQTASNPYITILGPIESAAKRISIMGIANKVAGALGSVIFGALLLSGIDKIKTQLESAAATEKNNLLEIMADSLITPYLVMAAVLFLLGIFIRKAPLPDVQPEPIDSSIENGISEKNSIFDFPHLWLGVIALFFYVGVEVIAGDTIIAYGISLGIPAEEAKFFTMLTLFAMVCTYGLGIILIPKYISQAFALKASAILGIVLTFCIVFSTGFTSVLCVAALGIANALVWPAVWPLTLKGLGKFTETASALLIMAIAGGAIIPPIYGKLVDRNKLDLISQGVDTITANTISATSGYWILLPCYLFILYYSISGHKLGLKKS